MPVEAREALRHFVVPAHAEHEADERGHRSVDGAEEKEGERYADKQTEDFSGARADGQGCIVLGGETQDVVSAGREFALQFVRHGQHGPGQESGAQAHLEGHRQNGLGGVAHNAGMVGWRALVRLEHAGQSGDGLDTTQREDDPGEGHPVGIKIRVREFDSLEGQVGDGQGDDSEHRREHGDAHGHGESAAVMRTEVVEPAEEQDHTDGRGRDPRTWHAEVGKRRPGAQGGCHGEVCDEEQRAHNGQQASMRSRRRVNAPAARETLADDDVVEPDDQTQRADCEDDGQRCEPHGRKRQPDHIRLAGSPISVKQPGRPAPAECPWTVNLHLCRLRIAPRHLPARLKNPASPRPPATRHGWPRSRRRGRSPA